MELPEANKIKGYLRLLEESDLFQMVEDIVLFFVKPRKFWNKFKSTSPRYKAKQFFLYFTIVCVVVFCLSNTEFAFFEVGKFFFTETSSVLPFWIVSTVILFTVRGGKEFWDSAKNTFFISIYAKALFCSIQSVFLYQYINTDSYAYLFLAGLVTLAAELYVIYISITFTDAHSKTKNILAGLLSGIICFAIIDGIHFLSGTRISDGTENFANHITREREEQIPKLFTNFLIPQAVAVTDSIPIVFYLYAMPTDTTMYRINVNDEQYVENIKSDIVKLESTLSRPMREVNREYVTDLIQIKKAIVNTHEHKTYSGCHQYHVLREKSGEAFGFTMADFNEDVWKDNRRLMKSYCWQYCQYDLAMIPSQLNILYRPLLIIPYVRDDTKALDSKLRINAWKAYFSLCKKEYKYTVQLK